MALLSMNEVTTFRWSFEEDVAHYKAAEIPAIGVWRQKISDYGDEKGAELLKESGLQVSNLLWAGGFTGNDGRTFRESLDDAADAVRLAATLGAPALVVYSGARAGHTHNHARRLFRDALKELTPLADEHNVDLAIEPMHPGCAGEWTFLTGLDDALAVLEAAASPRLKLVFDTYQVGGDADVVARIPEFVDRISIVHLGDGKQPPQGEQNRCRLGEGCVPLADVVAALAAAGYDGCYDVELIGEEIEADDYDDLLRHCRETFQRLTGATPPAE